jgi:Fe2+/Zn2+ uptake regulation proteins
VQTNDTGAMLRESGIQPSAQRVAVGDYVLYTNEHPSADLVWKRVREHFPWISRATVYNTLNLFADKGLLRRLNLSEDSIVFDPITEAHHHFIDEKSGVIHDVPWDRVQVCNIETLREFDVHDYQVVMRGSLKSPRRKHTSHPNARMPGENSKESSNSC